MKSKPPQQLPTEGLTAVKFKVWKSKLEIFVKQEPVNKLFLTGGAYGTWVANEDLPGRIRARVEADPLPENVTEAEHLVTRQTELVKFLGHVGDVVDSSQFEDVVRNLTV